MVTSVVFAMFMMLVMPTVVVVAILVVSRVWVVVIPRRCWIHVYRFGFVVIRGVSKSDTDMHICAGGRR